MSSILATRAKPIRDPSFCLKPTDVCPLCGGYDIKEEQQTRLWERALTWMTGKTLKMKEPCHEICGDAGMKSCVNWRRKAGEKLVKESPTSSSLTVRHVDKLLPLYKVLNFGRDSNLHILDCRSAISLFIHFLLFLQPLEDVFPNNKSSLRTSCERGTVRY